MKKFLLFGFLLAIVGIVATGCSCQSENKKQESAYHDYDGVVQDFTVGTAKIQALHRQTMYSTLGVKEYEWRNSRIIFNEAVTPENIGDLHVTDINDVFCYWNNGMWVQYVNSNVKNGVQIPWPVNDVWIEDGNMGNKEIKLSAEDAINKLKEWNGVLPKDCNFITLRLPVGPKDCNPQWTFGDVYNVLFIDAVTGEVADTNPAFRQ